MASDDTENLLNIIDQLMSYEQEYSSLLQIVRRDRNAFNKHMSELRELISSSTRLAEESYKIIKKFIMVIYGVRLSNIYFSGFEYLTSLEDFESFVDIWKDVHEDYLEYFVNIQGMEMRMDWWQEPTKEAQIISDIGKMFHDLAIILTHIHNIKDQKETLQPLITLIMPKIRAYDSVSIYLTGSDTINIQAETGHSVKVKLNGKINGQVGDYSPLVFIDASLDLSKMDQKTATRVLSKLCNLIAELISYEQNIRNIYNPTVRAVDDLLQDLQIYMISTNTMHDDQELADAIRNFLNNPSAKTAKLMYQYLNKDMRDKIHRIYESYMQVSNMWKEMVDISTEIINLIEKYGKINEGTDYEFALKIDTKLMQAIKDMFQMLSEEA